MPEAKVSRPRIAVCLAAYNGMTWLEPQISSILAQENVSINIIASVDPSVDGTETWMRNLVTTESRVIMLPLVAPSGGAAQNFFRILREASFDGYDYIALADQDDIWMPGKLARAVTQLAATQADAYSSNMLAFWPDGQQRLIRKAQPQRLWDHLFEAPGSGCTFVFSPVFVDALKKFLDDNASALRAVDFHDWFIYAYARTCGFIWFIDDYAGVHYRQHEHNVIGTNRGWRAFRRRAVLAMQGWHLQQARLTARMVGADRFAFVQQTLLGGPRGCIRLAWAARHCRRRIVDQWFLALSCVVVALRDWRGQGTSS